MKPFGKLLRKYRLECKDHETGKPFSSDRLANQLFAEVGLDYSGATIRNWELEKTQIDKENRLSLIGLLLVFSQQGVLKTLEEANGFLEAGNFRTLSGEEIEQIWPTSMPATSSTTRKNEPTKTLAKGDLKSAPFMCPPLPPQGVVGRRKLISTLVERLISENKDLESNSIGLLGFGGIGKTTLAISLAHQKEIRHRYPDGVFWAALGPQPQTRYLLERWGRELGLELVLERGERECSQRLRSAFDKLQALLIIDDIWDTTNSRHFFVAGQSSRTLFTTREPEPANLYAIQQNQFRVGFLDDKDALALLSRLAPDVVLAEEKSSKELCNRLGNLPLAITLAGRLLASEVYVPGKMKRVLAELIEHYDARLDLPQQEGRLGLDEDNPVSLQAILGMSVNRLRDLDKQRFAMLSVFGGEPLSWEIPEAQYVWDCSVEEAEDTVHQFILRGLVEPRETGEYSMHALLADYANELRVYLRL